MASEAYRAAGVDLAAAEGAKERIRALAALTHGPQVLGKSGGFAGMFRLEGYSRPVLVASTDGVGTKLKVASLLGHYESLGMDLVNLNVDDIVTCGAKPLFFLDYISVPRLDDQVLEPLIRGMVWACKEAECALIGGETAQSPGMYAGDQFDLAGTVVGVVEEGAAMAPSEIAPGDAVLGLPSSGLHTNGFSLVRKVFNVDDEPAVLYQRYDELAHTLGEELLIPHRCYYPLLAPHYARIKAMAHISGGGITGNIARVLPDGVRAVVRRGTWEPQPIFELVRKAGGLDAEEMFQVFNMGIGMALVCDAAEVEPLRRALPEAKVIGEVVKGEGAPKVAIE